MERVLVEIWAKNKILITGCYIRVEMIHTQININYISEIVCKYEFLPENLDDWLIDLLSIVRVFFIDRTEIKVVIDLCNTKNGA